MHSNGKDKERMHFDTEALLDLLELMLHKAIGVASIIRELNNGRSSDIDRAAAGNEEED